MKLTVQSFVTVKMRVLDLCQLLLCTEHLNSIIREFFRSYSTQLHSERPKLHIILAFLSATALKTSQYGGAKKLWH